MTAGGRLSDLLRSATVDDRLAPLGITGERADHVRTSVTACFQALRGVGVARGAAGHAFVVPGRIEVLGKHTDYAGGRSLLAAAERGFIVVAATRADARVRVIDASTGEAVCFELDPRLEPAAGWTKYPTTVVRRLARTFLSARIGADIALLSDLPPAAGMSSSSALVVATFLALAAANRLAEDDEYRRLIATPADLAGYLSSIENGQDFRTLRGDAGVGTRGGSEDHTAMLCAQPGRLVQHRFAPIRFERALPLPAGHCFVIAASGVRAEKAGAARARYNRAAELMGVIAELWRAGTGRDEVHVGAVLDSDPQAAGRLRELLSSAHHSEWPPDALVSRLDHFLAEHAEIIPAAGDALERADLAAFGALVDRSQSLAEQLLGNQIDETIYLAHAARDAGAVAASAFGAGFGGSVWALVEQAVAASFQQRWQADYAARFPDRVTEARFFQTGAGPPASRIL